jgi:hypothetical protein
MIRPPMRVNLRVEAAGQVVLDSAFHATGELCPSCPSGAKRTQDLSPGCLGPGGQSIPVAVRRPPMRVNLRKRIRSPVTATVHEANGVPNLIVFPKRQACLTSTRSRHPSVEMATAR